MPATVVTVCPPAVVIRSLKASHSVTGTRNRDVQMPASSSRRWTGDLPPAARASRAAASEGRFGERFAGTGEDRRSGSPPHSEEVAGRCALDAPLRSRGLLPRRLDPPGRGATLGSTGGWRGATPSATRRRCAASGCATSCPTRTACGACPPTSTSSAGMTTRRRNETPAPMPPSRHRPEALRARGPRPLVHVLLDAEP